MEERTDQEAILDECPECSEVFDVASCPPFSRVECPHCGSHVRIRRKMGQYDITDALGEGGMSQVFLAVDRYLQREVALKVLHEALSSDANLTAMFEREAKLTASILHRNVVKVYTVGRDQGYFFIAMELVKANSLEEIVAAKGALPEREALRIAHDVTSGLKAALDEGLIHRDIKPGNMLVTEEGTTKLVDFGLAVQQGGDDASEEVWATPYYVPPEKLDGDADTSLGDTYSLGATLYHAVAGRPPFDANTASMDELIVIKKQKVNLKAQAPNLSKQTLKLIEKMMAYSPADRFQSYDEILAEIATIEDWEYGVKRSVEPPRSKSKVSPLTGIAAAVVVAAIGAGIFFFVSNRDSNSLDAMTGLGDPERVIEAGDKAKIEQFLKGRELFARSNFKQALGIFGELKEDESLAPSIRMWSLFLSGTSQLFLADEKAARASFAAISEIEGDVGDQGDVSMMRQASPILASSLPVLDGGRVFGQSEFRELGWLASGLKNWELGEFESGASLLRSFADADVSATAPWMKRMKRAVRPYMNDSKLLAELPNPSRRSDQGLGEMSKTLRRQLGEVQTKGALPALIEARLERITEIKKLAKNGSRPSQPKATEERTVSRPPQPVAMNDTDAVIPTTKESPRGDRALDISRLKSLFERLPSQATTFRFDQWLSELKAVPVGSKIGERCQLDLTEIGQGANRFRAMVTDELRRNQFTGIVRRKEGVPLDATVSASDSMTLIVDLGFGPNQVPVEAVDPAWLIEVGTAILPAVSDESVSQWRAVASFAAALGETEIASKIAKDIAVVDPEFNQSWRRLRDVFGAN